MVDERKVYVVDSNVLMQTQDWYESLRDGLIVIPITVIQEIDKHKSSMDSVGLNSRVSARLIGKIADKMKENRIVDIDEGIFTIEFPEKQEDLRDILDFTLNDDLIISTAIKLKRKDKDSDIVLVSNDVNVRSKVLSLYDMLNIDSISLNYECKFSAIKDNYNVNHYNVDDKTLAMLYENKLTVDNFDNSLKCNSCVTLINNDKKIMCRVDSEGKNIIYIDKGKILASLKSSLFKPLNEQQMHLVDLIKNSKCKIISVNGVIGSGKSFGVCNALMDELNRGVYSKILIVKPNQPLGKTVGLLPNSWEEKTAPIKNSFRMTFSDLGYDLDRLEEQGKVEFTTGEYIRGCSYHNIAMFVDETQNLESVGVLKALIGRCDDSSLVVLASDARQVDFNKHNESNNPATIAMQKLSGQPYYACIHLNESVRASHLNSVDELL